MNKKQLIEFMIENLNEKSYKDLPPVLENDKDWTMSDLFIRQFLNNGSDGFGLENVAFVYGVLLKHKDLLIEEKMISKDGKNNSGFILWEDYNF